MNVTKLFQLISFAVMVWPTVALADIYRCVLISGAIEYQSVACAEAISETIISGRNTVAAPPLANLPGTGEQDKKPPVEKQEERTFWQRKVNAPDVQIPSENPESGNSLTKTDGSCREMSWARAVHAYLSEATLVRDVGNEAIYTIRPQSWQTIRLYLPQFIKAATYADTCVAGAARPVRFYSPDGEAIGL